MKSGLLASHWEGEKKKMPFQERRVKLKGEVNLREDTQGPTSEGEALPKKATTRALLVGPLQYMTAFPRMSCPNH
jgi:hypothetical protein